MTRPLRTDYTANDRHSAAEVNRVQAVVNNILKAAPQYGIVGADGAVVTRKPPGQRAGSVLVEVTAAGTTDGYYDAKELIWDGATGDFDDGPRTFDGEAGNLPELLHVTERVGIPIGSRGRARLLGAQWIFEPISATEAFPVDLAQTGGSAGDASTQCSFTYTVSDLDGNSLATTVDPTSSPHAFARPALGAMVAATAGLAAWVPDGSGGFELSVRWINEVPDVAACS